MQDQRRFSFRWDVRGVAHISLIHVIGPPLHNDLSF